MSKFLFRDWSYRLGRRREGVVRWIAWHLPQSVAYWAAIRIGAHATTGQYGNQVVPDLSFLDAIKRWNHAH